MSTCVRLQVKQLKDALMRALAETENVRARGQRQTEDAKKFAVQGFAKELLDVADNLTRATAAVPEDAATSDPAKHLAALKDGVLAVEQIMHQASPHVPLCPSFHSLSPARCVSVCVCV
jgi:molecular chaperone GrpE